MGTVLSAWKVPVGADEFVWKRGRRNGVLSVWAYYKVTRLRFQGESGAGTLKGYSRTERTRNPRRERRGKRRKVGSSPKNDEGVRSGRGDLGEGKERRTKDPPERCGTGGECTK